MQKFGEIICKYKKIILIISILLLIPAFIGMQKTKINYDILVYLPEDIETVKGENLLSEEFSMGGYSIVTIDNMPNKELLKLEDEIRKIDGVEKVISIADISGTTIPKEMLPNEITEKFYHENTTMMLVTFKEGISSDLTTKAVNNLRNITDERCKVGGMTSVLIDTKNLSDGEVLIYVIIAVILCIIILQLALDSYVVPIILLINIGIAILYNMGTNIFLGQISYITKAISAVLQLGVTTDFSIFLYHSYQSEKEKTKNNDEAMAKAISKTLVSVLGSSLTTVAGFLALCSMNLTLGKDIGIVMAKGVIFGVIAVVTVLPSLILISNKLIEKTSHKEFLPKFRHIRDFNIKHYKLILILFILLLPIAFYGYKNTKVYYKLDSSLPETLESIAANKELEKDFDMVATNLVLINKNIEDYKINEMLKEIEKLDGITWTLSYSKLSKDLPIEIMPEEISNIFESENYKMVIVNSKYEVASENLNNQIEELNKIVKKYDENAIVAGEGPLTKDLIQVSDHDFNSVNIVSIGVIFLLMFVVFKSLILPVILIFVIEFAIFINMGIPAFTGTVIPFVASIVIGTIQLGATIDYAILITNKYIVNKKDGMEKKEAVKEALGTSINSIVVSGLCFFGATFGVGVYSKIEMIGSLCALMARGAIVSSCIVITVLPAFLLICDKLICKLTLGLNKE